MNYKHKAATLAAMITAVHEELAALTKCVDMTAERANRASHDTAADAISAGNEIAGATMLVQDRLDKVQELARGILALNQMPVNK